MEGDSGSLLPNPPPAGALDFTGAAAATPNSGFQAAYQNFQLPPGSRWVTAPTMQTLLSGATPSFESIDPSLYAGVGQGGNSSLDSYTSGGATAQVVPWNINPNFANNPLLMGPAIPGGGTENLAAGTYTDPNPSTGLGTYYDYNLATGNATPTPQSLALSRETIIKNSGGLINLLPMLGMAIPMAAFGSVVAPALIGGIAGLGAAGAGAGGAAADLGDVATLGSFGDVAGAAGDVAGAAGDVAAPAGYVGDIATLGSFGDVGAAGGAAAAGGGTGTDLLGNVMQTYSAAKPYISGGQDLLKLAQAFTAPQQTQTQPTSLLAQPAVAHR